MDANPTWDFSSVRDEASQQHPPGPSAEPAPEPVFESGPEPTRTQPAPEPEPQPSTDRHYGPRTCRICLDTEEPKFPTDTTTTFGVSATSSRPTYVSDDPELGRLLSPCKCKGSQKYVHEGCLNAWRLANPTEARNYWQCPTCKFKYRISRLHWASALSNKWAQIALTVLIIILSIFVLGFMADPIFDLWSDPVGTISDTVTSVVTDIEALKPPPYQEPTTWSEHFVKGFFSLGIVGVFKSMIAMTPWQWWNLRQSGLINTTGRRQGTGRGRVENISWVFVIIGAFTFLMGVWKAVKKISVRVLERAKESVLDVGEDDDGDDPVPVAESKKEQ
ncbi:Fc.00g032100.m01.CDS01 [Cosmosporella sp. VM-42]